MGVRFSWWGRNRGYFQVKSQTVDKKLLWCRKSNVRL